MGDIHRSSAIIVPRTVFTTSSPPPRATYIIDEDYERKVDFDIRSSRKSHDDNYNNRNALTPAPRDTRFTVAGLYAKRETMGTPREREGRRGGAPPVGVLQGFRYAGGQPRGILKRTEGYGGEMTIPSRAYSTYIPQSPASATPQARPGTKPPAPFSVAAVLLMVVEFSFVKQARQPIDRQKGTSP